MLNLNEEGEAKKEYNSPIHHDGEDLGHSYVIKILPKSCRLVPSQSCLLSFLHHPYMHPFSICRFFIYLSPLIFNALGYYLCCCYGNGSC